MVSYDPLVAPIGGNYKENWRKRKVDGEMVQRPEIPSMCIANQLAEIETWGRNKTTVQMQYFTNAQISEWDLQNLFWNWLKRSLSIEQSRESLLLL